MMSTRPEQCGVYFNMNREKIKREKGEERKRGRGKDKKGKRGREKKGIESIG